jgi:hypothetical protein
VIFGNSVASGWDELVLVANAAFAGLAAVFNVLVASRSAIKGRILHTAIACLATGYCLAYILLLSTDISLLEWSSVMRGVALWAWMLVWCGPALLRLRSPIPRMFAAAVEKEIASQVEQAERESE